MWVRDEPRPRRRLTRGDYFGETALLEREPHAATVRAGSWLSVFSIRRSDFHTWGAPHVGAHIDDSLYKLQALRRFPTFEAMPDRELDALASRVLREQFAPGAVICREGDPADAIYLVESGQAEVSVGEEHRLLGPGSPFGKAAMLSRGPYRETVRALTPVDVFKLRRPDYEFLLAMSCAKDTTDVQDSAPDQRRRVCCTAPTGTA
jgi:CRP-like cAMP-binding protein